MAKPYYTSNDLIEAVKRKISFPINQNTFTEEDILAFANEEMAISQVPAIMQYHEEYLVHRVDVPLRANVSRYPMPDRAIGMRLRDIKFVDISGNLSNMTRVGAEDKDFFQQSNVSNEAFSFYLEGNDVVLTPSLSGTPTGSLAFFIYLRPNQLVTDDNAAIIDCFTKTFTISITSMIAGDTITIGDIVFTAVSGAPGANQFQIGGTSAITATNLVTSINSNGTYTATNGTPPTNSVIICSDILGLEITTSNSLILQIQNGQGIQFISIPSVITNGSLIDFLQTKPGHRIREFDITIPNSGISGNIINFDNDMVPDDLVVGDYICLANECIIPGIPPDLHTSLAERTCARILAAMGDQAGLATIQAKIQETENRQGTLLDNRAESTPLKFTAKNSILFWTKSRSNRNRF